jgi:hypothetical protein
VHCSALKVLSGQSMKLCDLDYWNDRYGSECCTWHDPCLHGIHANTFCSVLDGAVAARRYAPEALRLTGWLPKAAPWCPCQYVRHGDRTMLLQSISKLLCAFKAGWDHKCVGGALCCASGAPWPCMALALDNMDRVLWLVPALFPVPKSFNVSSATVYV